MARPSITIVQSDVLQTLRRLKGLNLRVKAVILDPPYNKGYGGVRRDYLPWLLRVVRAAGRLGDHVFVWGFPDTLAHVVPRIPTFLRFKAWITWSYGNAPTHVRGWRPSQQACLHLTRPGAKMYPENFFTPEQRRRFEEGTLRYPPSPPSVITAGLIVGWAGRSEATGHPAQKPERVIEPLVLMSTAPGDIVVDPMAGSGTTGAVALRLGRRAILGEIDEEHVRRIEDRLHVTRENGVTSSKRRRVGGVHPTEGRRLEALRLLLQEGLSQAETARRLHVSRESVRRWLVAHREGTSLAPRPRRGGVSRLGYLEERRLERAARAGKLTGSLMEIAATIERLTGTRYSRGHIPRLLERLGIGASI